MRFTLTSGRKLNNHMFSISMSGTYCNLFCAFDKKVVSFQNKLMRAPRLFLKLGFLFYAHFQHASHSLYQTSQK